jgi:hypothetical protein
MQKTLIGLTIGVAAVFGIGFAAGQIGGIAGSSAATSSKTQTKPPQRFGHPLGARPQAVGKVTAVAGSTITITPDSHIGMVTTINVSSSTKYESGPNQSSSLSAVKVGAFIGAEGTVSSDGLTLTATSVQLFDSHRPMGPGGPGGPGALGPHADGKVTAVNGSTITIAADADTHPGAADEYTKVTTITVSSSTKYESGPGRTTSLSSVKVGSFILATGTVSSDGTTLTATRVIVPDHMRAMGPPPGAPNGVLPSSDIPSRWSGSNDQGGGI